MSQHLKALLLLAGAVGCSLSAVFLAGGCQAQALARANSVNTSGEQPPPNAATHGVGIDLALTPSATPNGLRSATDTKEVTAVESDRIDPITPNPARPAEVDPDSIPSPEELNRMLDEVNQGPRRPVPPGNAVGEGPQPGTESGPRSSSERTDPGSRDAPLSPQGEVVDTDQVTVAGSDQINSVTPTDVVYPQPAQPGGDVDPDSIPSPEELNRMLDQVNRGPTRPVPPGNAVGEGPGAGTESGPEPRSDSGPPWSAWVQKTAATLRRFFSWVVETLRS